MGDPISERFARPIGDLETYRCAGLALYDRCSLPDRSRGVDVGHLQPDEIATSQLAIDSHIEEGQVACSSGQLKPDADSPNVFGKQWSFLANDATVVPSSL